jgi:hypothetical protein
MQIHVFILLQKKRVQHQARNKCELAANASIMQLLNTVSSYFLSADLFFDDWSLSQNKTRLNWHF